MIELFQIQQIEDILTNYSTIAVAGLSPKPERPSHMVSLYMQTAGYRIIPINPGHAEILGQRCYPDLLSVPENFEIVNIFRRSDHVLPIVLAAIEKQAKVIWMQKGIINNEAAALAKKHGLTVIMDRCIMVDHQQIHLGRDRV